MQSNKSNTNYNIDAKKEVKDSTESDLIPKVWTTEDLFEMVGTNGWRNYTVIFLSLSCKLTLIPSVFFKFVY